MSCSWTTTISSAVASRRFRRPVPRRTAGTSIRGCSIRATGGSAGFRRTSTCSAAPRTSSTAGCSRFPALSPRPIPTSSHVMIGSHVFLRETLAGEGQPLAPLPFVGATYRVGHAGSRSRSDGLRKDPLQPARPEHAEEISDGHVQSPANHSFGSKGVLRPSAYLMLDHLKAGQ